MKNPFVRWAVILGGGLVALALVAAGTLFFFLSRFDAKAEIEKAVREATGRELTIAGDVGVSLFPVLGLTAHDAALANVEGGRAPALASMEAISVAVEIWPLLRQEIDVRGLVLEAPKIALEIDAEGNANWVLTPAAPPAQTPGAPAAEPQLSLAEVRVQNGQVSFYDAATNTGWVVSEANLRTAVTSLDDPMRITGEVAYNQTEIGLDLTIGHPRAAFAGAATPVTLALDSELMEARFVGQTQASSAELNGDVRAHGESLKRLAAWLGAPIAGVAGLESFAVQGKVTISGGQLAFSNAAFVVDKLRGRGDFNVRAASERPYLSGRVELFALDFNPYLTGAAPEGEADPNAALAAVEAGEAPVLAQAAEAVSAPAPRALDVDAAPSETPIDFSGLKAINADLEVTTHALRFQSLSIDGSQSTLVLNDGFLAATLHRLALYGGSGRGRLQVDAREATVKIEEDLAITGVDARTFLMDAANFDNLEGTADLTLGLRSQGRTQSEFIGAADGRAHIEVVSGALRGVDLGGVSRTIRNAMRGELVGPDKRTAFQGFSADFSVADGVLGSDSLSFNTSDLRITGLTVIDLPNRRIDARFAPRSPQGGIVVPFTVRGNWERPLEYNSDIRGIVQRELQGRVAQIKQDARQR